MKRTAVEFALSLAITLFFIGGITKAQTQITTGVIQGTVVDQSGAVIPDAKIEVKSADTNQTRNLTSDTDGRFVFLQLPPGRYTLTVSKQGFTTIVQENLDLNVGQAISLTMNLKVSGTEERVTITASPVIDNTQTESSTTLN
ncbi:MAG: carboxypeptidase-like regulatory domain-containing protein, partial [Blastocatellia bacterium]